MLFLSNISHALLLFPIVLLSIRFAEVNSRENGDTGGVYSFPFRYLTHVTPRGIRRQLQLGTSQLLPHFDASMAGGALYIDLYVGNPAQKQTLAISIAGDFVAFPCVGCTDCGTKVEEFYKMDQSDSYEKLTCGNCDALASCENNQCIIRDTYLDGSSKWVAYQVKDLVYVEGQGGNRDPEGTNFAKLYGFPLSFGCLTQMSGYFDTNSADGLLGMSPSKLSFINQLYNAGRVKAPIFGLCFNNLDGHVIPKGYSAGAISLGGVDKGFHNTPLVWAKNSDPRKMTHRVYLERMYIRPGGGKSVASTVPYSKYKIIDGDYKYANSVGRGVHLDTGEPHTHMDKMLEQPFKQAWLAVTNTDYDTDSFHATEAEYKALPTIIFQFTGWDTTIKQDPEPIAGFAGNLDVYNPFSVIVSMPPGAYMLFNETKGYYEPTLFFDSIVGSVLGVNLMTGHHIVFDIISNRIGFSETDVCIKDPTNSSLPKPMGYFGQPGPDGKLIGDPTGEVSGGGDLKEMEGGDGETSGILPPRSPFDGGTRIELTNPCGTGLYYSACCSATCRSFVAVCYATVLISFIAAFVAMTSSKSRRVKTSSSSAHPDGSALSQGTSVSRTDDQYRPVSLTGISSRPSLLSSPYSSQMQPYTDSYSGISRRGGNFVV